MPIGSSEFKAGAAAMRADAAVWAAAMGFETASVHEPSTLAHDEYVPLRLLPEVASRIGTCHAASLPAGRHVRCRSPMVGAVAAPRSRRLAATFDSHGAARAGDCSARMAAMGQSYRTAAPRVRRTPRPALLPKWFCTSRRVQPYLGRQYANNRGRRRRERRARLVRAPLHILIRDSCQFY